MSGARDAINYRVMAAFTDDEAAELLGHHMYFKLNPLAATGVYPPADEVAAIRVNYASTFAFLIGALGPRARTLARCINSLPPGAELVADSKLHTLGSSIPGAVCTYESLLTTHMRLPSTLARFTSSLLPDLRCIVIAEELLPFLPSTLPATVVGILAVSTPAADGPLSSPAAAVRVDCEMMFTSSYAVLSFATCLPASLHSLTHITFLMRVLSLLWAQLTHSKLSRPGSDSSKVCCRACSP